MLDYKFDKNGTYLLSGTFGPDSMALLDMVQKEGIKPIVCCVNYHKFDQSNEDFNRLRDYCDKNGLKFEGFDTDELPASAQLREGETFASWARKIRYDWFKNVYAKYNAVGLLLAHQQDDLIETYLLQSRGESNVTHYGLAKASTYEGMIIIRPLLNFTHDDLLDYDHENRIAYSAQSDAFQNEYTRSPIRKEIAAMSEIDRERVLMEMRSKNDDAFRLHDSISRDIQVGEELEIRPLIALPYDAFVTTLMEFVSKGKNPVHLTATMVSNIRKMCLAPQPNLSIKLADGVYVMKEYDILTIGDSFDECPYTYHLDAPGVLNTPQFDLDFSMGAEDRGIKAEDYPLTIRTATVSDSVVVHGYLYNVRTMYSNWAMPVEMRNIWPVFVNKDGKVIYVPRYRTNFTEYHTSVLRLHPKGEEK